MCFNLPSLHLGCNYIFWGTRFGKDRSWKKCWWVTIWSVRYVIIPWPVELINWYYPSTLWWPTECWSFGPAQLPIPVDFRDVQSHWKCRWLNSQFSISWFPYSNIFEVSPCPLDCFTDVSEIFVAQFPMMILPSNQMPQGALQHNGRLSPWDLQPCWRDSKSATLPKAHWRISWDAWQQMEHIYP